MLAHIISVLIICIFHKLITKTTDKVLDVAVNLTVTGISAGTNKLVSVMKNKVKLIDSKDDSKDDNKNTQKDNKKEINDEEHKGGALPEKQHDEDEISDIIDVEK